MEYFDIPLKPVWTRSTDRQTDRQTDKQTETLTETEMDRQVDRLRHRENSDINLLESELLM